MFADLVILASQRYERAGCLLTGISIHAVLALKWCTIGRETMDQHCRDNEA